MVYIDEFELSAPTDILPTGLDLIDQAVNWIHLPIRVFSVGDMLVGSAGNHNNMPGMLLIDADVAGAIAVDTFVSVIHFSGPCGHTCEHSFL